MLQDFRFAVRNLLHQPVFALVAVLTVALGIGANAAIFSVVDTVILRPMPYPNGERMRFVWQLFDRVSQRFGIRAHAAIARDDRHQLRRLAEQLRRREAIRARAAGRLNAEQERAAVRALRTFADHCRAGLWRTESAPAAFRARRRETLRLPTIGVDEFRRGAGRESDVRPVSNGSPVSTGGRKMPAAMSSSHRLPADVRAVVPGGTSSATTRPRAVTAIRSPASTRRIYRLR